jgi:hypothetical protein
MTLRRERWILFSAGPTLKVTCDRSDLSEETGKRAFGRLHPIRMREGARRKLEMRNKDRMVITVTPFFLLQPFESVRYISPCELPTQPERERSHSEEYWLQPASHG